MIRFSHNMSYPSYSWLHLVHQHISRFSCLFRTDRNVHTTQHRNNSLVVRHNLFAWWLLPDRRCSSIGFVHGKVMYARLCATWPEVSIRWWTVFHRLLQQFKMNNAGIAVVTDGKRALGNAITNVFGDKWKLASRSNHLLWDTDFWLKKNAASNEDMFIYKSLMTEMLGCATDKELNMTFETPRPTWSEPCVVFWRKLVVTFTDWLPWLS